MAVDAQRYTLARTRAADTLAANPALIPALLAMGVLVALCGTEAGFHARHWYAAALFLLGLLGITVVAIGPPRGVPRAVLAALALLAAYALWSYVSITWASEQGPAWDGANRTAMYVVLFALFALWPFDGRGVTLLIGLAGLGIAGLGLVELLKANAAEHAGDYFIDVRFAEPAGYMNANAALWTTGLLACLFLNTRREVPAALRGLALGGAGLLAGLALLAQSRGWALALPCALAIFLLLYADRVRLLAATVAVAIAAFTVRGPVLAVHDDYTPARLDGLVADAAGAILLAAAILVAVGVAAALIDRRVRLAPGARRTANVAVAVLVAVALVAGIGVYAANEGSPTARIADAWDDFKAGGQGPGAGVSRFAGGSGTNRYDFWKVAWHAFEDEPVTGMGAENFQEEYLMKGTSAEQPLYAHSLELGAISQTGLPGALLLLGALGTAVVAALRARRLTPAGPTAAAAALSLFAYWLLHASVDWFWEFPALTGIAIAALGLACAVIPRRATAPRRQGLPVLVPAGLVVVALAASFALPWLAELQIHRATQVWRGDPDAAFRRLDSAADLNPLSATAQLTSATIALRLDRPELARRDFEAALERQPRSAYALLELGVMAAERGDRPSGLRLVGRAARLSPRDSLTEDMLRRIRRGRQVDVKALNRAILVRARGHGQRTR
jgi:O-antigen ligase